MDRNRVKQEEKALFKKWKTQYKEDLEQSGEKEKGFFVTDGMVNPLAYKNIVFVLKEVNGATKEWHLSEMLQGGSNGNSWNNIARWTKGLTCASPQEACDLVWDDTIEKIRQEDRDIQLAKVATMNLKKISGTSEAKWPEIKAFSEKYEKNLQEQISLYDPEIIICCGGGGKFLDDILFRDEQTKEIIPSQRTSRGIWYRKKGNLINIFFFHPNARMNSNILYYTLMDAVREIKEN